MPDGDLDEFISASLKQGMYLQLDPALIQEQFAMNPDMGFNKAHIGSFSTQAVMLNVQVSRFLFIQRGAKCLKTLMEHTF